MDLISASQHTCTTIYYLSIYLSIHKINVSTILFFSSSSMLAQGSPLRIALNQLWQMPKVLVLRLEPPVTGSAGPKRAQNAEKASKRSSRACRPGVPKKCWKGLKSHEKVSLGLALPVTGRYTRNLSGQFRRNSSLAIPHHTSFAATPSVSWVHLGHTNHNVSVSHESQREVALVWAISGPIPDYQQGWEGVSQLKLPLEGIAIFWWALQRIASPTVVQWASMVLERTPLPKCLPKPFATKDLCHHGSLITIHPEIFTNWFPSRFFCIFFCNFYGNSLRHQFFL